VLFNHLTDEEIQYYIQKYQPYDKAGAYGIQEWLGNIAIARIEGSYTNVMGLPTEALYNALRSFEL
jgi:septum formation protein